MLKQEVWIAHRQYQAVFTFLDLGCFQAMYGDSKVEMNFMHRKCNTSSVNTVAVLSRLTKNLHADEN